MEKVYYKGKILKVSELQKKSLFIGDLKNYGYCVSSDTFLDFINTLKLDIYDKLIEEFDSVINNESINLENPIFSSVKKEINNSLINLHENKQDTVEVIFEIITTRNGDLYGKELYTGLLFPIANMNKIEYRIEVEVQTDIIKNKEENQIYFIDLNNNKFYDCHHYNIYNSKTALFSVVYYEERPYLNEKFWSSTRNMDYYFTSCRSYDLYPLINSFENLDLCESIVFNHAVANQNEVDKYLNQFNAFSTKRKKKKFIKQIETEYNRNVYNSEIEEKEQIKKIPKQKIEKDKTTLKLENIEYLLAILKQKNIEMYEVFLKEYNAILDSETQALTLNPLTIDNLTLLEAKIEIYLNYSKNNINHISELLNNLKEEYLNNFLNDSEKTTKLTISDIDKINELFLNTKNKYTIKEQQAILKDIAFLYIMEIIEDKNIKIEDLENSYFEDNLKYILIVIMSLIESDIIENNILIDYEIDLDLYNIFNIIKNIKLKKQHQKINKKF